MWESFKEALFAGKDIFEAWGLSSTFGIIITIIVTFLALILFIAKVADFLDQFFSFNEWASNLIDRTLNLFINLFIIIFFLIGIYAIVQIVFNI